MLRSATASAASTGPVVYSQSGIGQDMLAIVNVKDGGCTRSSESPPGTGGTASSVGNVHR